MKHILLMSGTKAGVDGYHTWSQKDIATHMAVLKGINKELTEFGEFVATQGLVGHYRLNAVRAHLFEMIGDYESAAKNYRIAASRTTSVPSPNSCAPAGIRSHSRPSRDHTECFQNGS